jgi:hypothetical protein
MRSDEQYQIEGADAQPSIWHSIKIGATVLEKWHYKSRNLYNWIISKHKDFLKNVYYAFSLHVAFQMLFAPISI